MIRERMKTTLTAILFGMVLAAGMLIASSVTHGISNRAAAATDSAAIVLSKTVGLDPSICAATQAVVVGAGTAVTYCFEITNTGTITLSRHDLVDSHLGTILDGFAFSLAPSASVFLTQTAIITQATTNSATWTAYNPGPTDLVAANSSATVTVVPPSIRLAKTVGLDSSACADSQSISVEASTPVTYCFEVTNTGLTTLSHHDLVDSHLGAILDGFAFSLAPSATVFLTQTAIITQTTINTATWTATHAGFSVQASDVSSAAVTVVPPSIALSKTVGLDPHTCAATQVVEVEAGTPVTYCFEVTNTGLTELTRHDLVDSHLGTILDGFTLSLAPSATIVLTQTAVISETTANTATWTAYNPGPVDQVAGTSSATVAVPTEPSEEEAAEYEIALPALLRE